MSALIRWYPGDWALDCFLVMTLGVALFSTAGWLLSLRLTRMPATRHLVLFSALICCLALPALVWACAASGMTLISIPILPAEQAEAQVGLVAIAPTPGSMPRQRFTDDPRTKIERGAPAPWRLDLPPVDSAPVSLNRNESIDRSGGIAAAAVTTQVDSTSKPREPDVYRAGSPAGKRASFRGFATLALVTWGVVGLLLLVRLSRSCWRVVQLRRSSRPLQNESFRVLLEDVGRKLGAHQVPHLLMSGRVITPIAVGLGRPAVILPERLVGAIRDDEMRDVLIHEVAHIRRRDHLIVLLQELARALFWPIVSVHGLNRELEWAREELCDNFVLKDRDPLSYGETLLHVAGLLLEARPTGAAVGILHWRGQLECRIAGLLDPGRSRMTRTSRRLPCVMMFLFIAGGTIASTTRFELAGPAAKASAEPVT
jgi:beta-lactamase regulating signal transducer with metallopeptidase domain